MKTIIKLNKNKYIYKKIKLSTSIVTVYYLLKNVLSMVTLEIQITTTNKLKSALWNIWPT